MLGCSMNVKAKTLLHFLLPAVLKWVYSSGTSITIANDNWNLVCRSSVTLTCRLQSVPLVAMTWYVNGIAATTCTSSSCSLTPEMPGHFIPAVENGTTYNLNINPIKLSDSQTTIYCSDGTDSPTGNVQVKVLANELTVTTQDIEDNKVNITALTNCVYSPMANVRFVLKYDANGDNTTFTNYGEVLDPKGVIKCSYVDNPDCGGNTTEKAIGETTIQKASTGSKGVSHNFKIAVLESSIERVTKYIGSYMVQDNNTDISTLTPTTTPHVSPTQDNNTDTTTPNQPTSATQSTNATTEDTTTQTNTDITVSDNSDNAMPKPYILLTVGGSILLLLISSGVFHIVYICISKMKRKEKQEELPFSNIYDAVLSTDM